MSYNSFGRLSDRDDDVRAVAASCLLPVAAHLVEQIPESLDRVLVVLWSCLSDMKDDLSSSVGAVMALLGENTITFVEYLPDKWAGCRQARDLRESY
jgi:TATA-binding protein-associated factor